MNPRTIESHRRYRSDLHHSPPQESHWGPISAILLSIAILIEGMWVVLGIVVGHNPHHGSRIWLLAIRPAIVTAIATIAETFIAYLITRPYPTPVADKLAYLLAVVALAAATTLAIV